MSESSILSLEALLNAATAAVPASPVTSNVSTVAITDESITSSEFDYYKLGKDRTDRLAILMPARITSGRTHYVEEKGYFFCNSQWVKNGMTEVIKQPAAACCQKLDPPRQRFSALVLQFNTTGKGELVKPFGYMMRVWRFSTNTFEQLRAINADWPLGVHDVKVTLDGDEKYQKATINPCKDSVASNPDFLKAYGPEVQNWVTTTLSRIEKTLGRKLDAAGWAEVLGSAAPGGAATVAADAPITDIGDLIKIE